LRPRAPTKRMLIDRKEKISLLPAPEENIMKEEGALGLELEHDGSNPFYVCDGPTNGTRKGKESFP